MLLTGEAPDSVSVLTPSGENVSVDIMQSKASSENNSDILDTVNITQNKTQPQMDRTAEFYVVKDSGDDPDITNGAKVYVKVQTVDITQSADLQLYSSYDRKTEESKSDQVSVTDNCFIDDTYPGIYIAGGEGVGIVTKEGLEQPVGYPAINKVPRRMIFETVYKIKSEAGYDGSILITVSVENGRELAAKTFNPELGIEGGISILGTSGILEPMSDKAIVDTIEALIKQQAALGRRTLLVTPGQYGQGYVKNELKIDVADSIKCSNFIGDAIDIAVSYDFTHVLLVGNLGKLIKLAAGIMNTHSRVADGRMDVMCTHLAMCGGTADMVRRMYECINTDSALDKLKEWDLYDEVLGSIISMIHKRLLKRAGDKLRIGAFVFSEKYGYLGETEFAGEALKAYREEAKAK